MRSLWCQRWRERRGLRRPAGEPIDPSRYGVEPLDSDAVARAFVERHHYSGSYVAARYRVGLRRVGGELAGVAVFSVGTSAASARKHCGTAAAVQLGRFVLLDDVPGNGESWFLARALRLLRQAKPDVRAVLSYSDPVPRHALDGRVVTPGHVGTIYQASNAVHTGRGRAAWLWLDPDGRVVAPRSLVKIRRGERGARTAAARLLEAGAPRQRRGESAAAWVARALDEGPFRRFRHPGNLAYVFALDRATRATVAAAKPYPCACSACRVQIL